MSVYLVWGECGEYSGWSGEVLCVVKTRAEAERAVQWLEAASRIVRATRSWDAMRERAGRLGAPQICTQRYPQFAAVPIKTGMPAFDVFNICNGTMP